MIPTPAEMNEHVRSLCAQNEIIISESAARVLKFSRFSPDETSDLRPKICYFRPKLREGTISRWLTPRFVHREVFDADVHQI